MASAASERDLLAFADSLDAGSVDLTSSSGAIQSRLAIPENRLRLYRQILRSGLTAAELSAAIRGAARTAAIAAEDRNEIEVAWTYAGDSRPGLRTTAGVSKEIVEGSRDTLLVVGYSIGGDRSDRPLASQTMAAIAAAAERGVEMTVVLHREANRDAFLRWWRAGVRVPAVFTWPVSDDEKAAVHAKLLIADRRDGLITSANLTFHGFEKNLEMGLRVTGSACAEIHDRIHQLIGDGELVPWNEVNL